MDRILEPEVMDGQEQASAYAFADFAAPNAAFVQRFLALFPEFCCLGKRAASATVVDLGCGPADIPLRLCAAVPRLSVVGVDASAAMIAHARAAVAAAGFQDRVQLVEAYLPAALPGPFDAVVSNSLLHHLPDPSVLWETVARDAKPGAPILVVDLFRPPNEPAARGIVDEYAQGEPEVLQHDFFHSLCAAFEPGEIQGQLDAARLGYLRVETISDRHVAIWGELRG